MAGGSRHRYADFGTFRVSQAGARFGNSLQHSCNTPLHMPGIACSTRWVTSWIIPKRAALLWIKT